MNRFEKILSQNGMAIRRRNIRTLQLNIGRKCNQACRHCHVDAAPWRTEMMEEPAVEQICDWIVTHQPEVVDITGGAPELNPHFRHLVEVSRNAGSHIIDRNNLTIIEEPGFDWLPGFLAKHNVEIIASLPCYEPENVTRQRGAQVFVKSITALRKLNALGYGRVLPLNLVYNPVGATLPPPQEDLEADYRESLKRVHGIFFSNLYVLTNQPIGRFAEDLRKQEKLDDYLTVLTDNFNPSAAENVMCRDTLSVDHEGRLFDCDFNQMLNLQMHNGRPLRLWEINPEDVLGQPVMTGDHCLACTAGCGSSCTGTLA